ncbi:PREDICTED: protein FAM208B, partial [Chlamydotis macqueenii]
FQLEWKESSSLLQTAVSVLQSSYLDSTSRDGFQYSQAILVENNVFLSELKAFAQAKEAAGYSQEELEETFAFLLFDNEEEAKEVCRTGLRVNSSSISTLGDPAKGVYISKYADCLHPRPWYHGKSGYIVICKLIKGKVKVVSENYTTSYTCPSPGYDCHVAVSRSDLTSKTSHCEAFQQSQYYVYEVSNGSTAERPRQICPYIVIACQYREPKEMPVLAIENLPELNHKALYCPWRGQLSIQGQLLCDIALRTPYSSTIPAQLPPSLDINHVMGLSDLKKKLPEAAFGKINYAENEGERKTHQYTGRQTFSFLHDLPMSVFTNCTPIFLGVYFSLYEVEISDKDQYKMDQLVENLKEKDLAIIKYLRDRGVLILLTSSALARDDGFDPKEPVSLLALFLFTSSRSVSLRGAEVLSAEFVHKTQSEPVRKETSAPDDPGLETKRPKTLKNPDVKKVPVAETVTKPVKKWKEPSSVFPSEVSSQCHGADSQTSEMCPGGVADLSFDLKGNDCESHALNLLADLALSSCVPSFIPRDSETVAVSCSPSSDSAKEQQSHRKHKSLRVASDHEYHRVDKLAKGATSPSKALLNQKLPPAEKTDLNDLASIPGERSPGIFSRRNSASPNPAKPHALPPRETQEAAEANKHSLISAEHSYASQMPEHSKKHVCPRGVPYPGPALSRNGTRNAQAGPLVGKVLPFRHQQNSTHHQLPFEAVTMRRRSSLLSPRLKEDFSKSHTVNICGESVKVTCHWEAEYLFNLDSRYTNDALEKTVIRALHGPWDPDLPDDVEEMKLILHMWVALFYSKPSKLLSSRRKVVEHSNPEKYVSINTTGDFLELSDDGEDCFGLETCPADSRSDPDQTPSSSVDGSTHCQGPFRPEQSPADSQTDADGTPGVVDSMVSSSSGELPCGEEEPSSTSCPESLSLTDHADESLAVEDRQPVVVPEERVRDVSTIAAEELPKEGQPDATIAPSPSDELDPHRHLFEQSKQELALVLRQHGKPCEQVGAAELSVAAESPGGSLKPRCAEEVKKETSLCHAEPAESSPGDVLVPGDLRTAPPSPPCGPKAGARSAEPDSLLGVYPKALSPGRSPAPDHAPWSCCLGTWPRCASPGDQAVDAAESHEEEPILPEDLEEGSSVSLASPASFSVGELLVPLCELQSACSRGEHEPEGSNAFADPRRAGTEVGEGEIACQ